MFKKLLVVCAVFSMITSALASRIAIVDSGTDYKHPFLKDHFLINKDKHEGYPDDTYGWNFGDGNNQIIDYSLQDTYSSDVAKFFEVQTHSLEGTVTEEEKAWVKEKRADEAFMKNLATFAGYAHGSHVAGISVRGHDESKIFAAKLIPTQRQAEMNLALEKFMANVPFDLSAREFTPGLGMMIGKFAATYLLKQMAPQQAEQMGKIGSYLDLWKADTANGSFGMNIEGLAEMIRPITGKPQGEAYTEEELAYLFKDGLDALLEAEKSFVTNAPNTMFVFAAGNSGFDNDKIPAVPGNLNTDNAISVAATIHNVKLPAFSDYGATTVHVAAPGVGLISSIPGGEMMMMTGTSMAAPYVTNVAAHLKDLNSTLAPKDIKKILIATCDAKDWLAGKVVCGGTVNPERAYQAARNALTMPLDAAIVSAKTMVKDMDAPTVAPYLARGRVFYKKLTSEFIDRLEKDLYVTPMPSL